MSTKATRRATRKVSKCKGAGKRLVSCRKGIKTRSTTRKCGSAAKNLVGCRWRK